MRQRLISAAALVPVVVILLVLGPPWLTIGIALLAALAAYETTQLLRAAGLPSSTWLPVIWAPLAVLGFAWFVGPGAITLGWALVAPGIAVLVVLAAILAFSNRDPTEGFRAWIGSVFAGVYPGLLAFPAALIGIAPTSQDVLLFGYHLDSGRTWLLILIATVWTLDSAGYLVGRLYGRGRFMNHISPKKTWSGAIGGTIAAVVVCTLLFTASGQSQVGGAFLGLVIAVTAQAGDLAESMLKRAAGAKDSGRLIPGHGGFLDRVDSFLFAAPAFYASLATLGVLRAAGVL
ncbi:MAG: phosphatidate cytidylyltransferase [Candidatus Limnocylindrales bacterium]